MDHPLEAILRQLPLLDGIDPNTIEQIGAISQRIEIPPGTIVFHEGDPADDIYLIISGSISIEICAPSRGCRRILTVNEGDLLSWSPLLGQERMTATARALVPTSAVRIRGCDIISLCEKDVHFGYQFMRRVAQVLALRLSATRLQLLNIYGDPV